MYLRGIAFKFSAIKFIFSLNSLSIRDKNTEFANSVDLDEVAHNEPPHLYLHCLHYSI